MTDLEKHLMIESAIAAERARLCEAVEKMASADVTQVGDPDGKVVDSLISKSEVLQLLQEGE